MVGLVKCKGVAGGRFFKTHPSPVRFFAEFLLRCGATRPALGRFFNHVFAYKGPDGPPKAGIARIGEFAGRRPKTCAHVARHGLSEGRRYAGPPGKPAAAG